MIMSANKAMYLYLGSEVNRKYFPNNRAAAFSVKLPKSVQLTPYGDWMVALADIEMPGFISGYEPKFVTIYSDICRTSIYGEGLKQVLHRIYYQDLRTNTSVVFNPLRYKGIITDSLDTIQLYLLDEQDNPPSFKNEPLFCTLHIKNIGLP
jgi:hypothetical protein